MYYNENTIVYHNGSFMKAVDAHGNLYDQSLHYGYAVFEGIRAYDTAHGVKIFKAKEHFERMEYSAKVIGIPYAFDNASLIDTCYELLAKNKLRNAYLRPLVTCTPNMSLTKGKGSQIFIAAWEWGAYLGHQLLRLRTSSFRRITPACFKVDAKVSGHYVNSIMATQEAKDLGFDEALMLDVDGCIAEAPGANVFIEKDGVLYTPQKGSILPGITRATVLEICKEHDFTVVEKPISIEEFKSADGAFLCGTAAEVIGVQSLDDTVFPIEWDESIGAQVQRFYQQKVLGLEYSQLQDVA